MELSPMSMSNNYEGVSGNSRTPWYRNKRILMMAFAAVIFIISIGALLANVIPRFKGKGKGDPEVNFMRRKSSKSKVFTALPSITWNGTCPERAAKCPSSFQESPPLILVSLDGFRPDYLYRSFTSTIQNISECGAKAKFMYPVYPSKTFPNHYSQVTGLNPASHGIIDNQMYDPKKGQRFKVGESSMLAPYWWEKEPIWLTAMKQGKKAACFFWPGSEVKINGMYPTHYRKYDGSIPFEERVDQVLKWLDLPVDSRPNFLTLYVNEPDHAAHAFGTNSNQVNQALKKVDDMVARLFSGLQQRKIVGCVNVVILSDHGMADSDCSQVVDLRNLLDISTVYYINGPFGRLRPKGYFDKTKIRDTIASSRCKNEHMRVYPKEQLPIRMHFSDNKRIEPIVLDLDTGWNIVNKDVKSDPRICTGGTHGYDNLFPDMRAIFMAHGPAFKQNYVGEPFVNTELYEMFCELLGISPNPNNGTRGSLHHMMTSPRSLPNQAEPPSPAVPKLPKDDAEYETRVSTAGCLGNQPTKMSEVDSSAVTERRSLHLPFGVPFDAQNNDSLRLLFNNDYVSAFDAKYRMPMWTSFTITGQKEVTNADTIIWKGDPRILPQETSRCEDYASSQFKEQSILQRPLYPPSFSSGAAQEEANFITNSVPKSLNHTNLLEKTMNQILSHTSEEESQLNIVMGPAFDFSATAVKPDVKIMKKAQEKSGPLLVPTHIYIITTWCEDKSLTLKTCQSTKLKTLAYLLPNFPYAQNCEPGYRTIARNAARVVDIENLTGISFFTGLPIYDAIRLRTAMPEVQLL
ncbi:venom phosphodiesterase-like [Uloborus diversus]|uniref:venom phosphodiesterase-like n=1 Tax=Uloborus diversus TaxID=327109 RepID=UPI0024099572|nr:venom phosphodiesterase-like [Uloborus diversus]